MEIPERNTRTEIKEEPYEETVSTEIEFNPERHVFSVAWLSNERIPFTLELKEESKNNSELESTVKIKLEPSELSPVQSDSNICNDDDDEKDSKLELKKEPICEESYPADSTHLQDTEFVAVPHCQEIATAAVMLPQQPPKEPSTSWEDPRRLAMGSQLQNRYINKTRPSLGQTVVQAYRDANEDLMSSLNKIADSLVLKNKIGAEEIKMKALKLKLEIAEARMNGIEVGLEI